ncbi:MAG: T9SS type A sorting domain-containing protein [bacterium]|nr:T9SS type A sorting domain-containing protein [bacterium]
MRTLLSTLLIIIFQLSFLNISFAQFEPVSNGSLAWGDYDNDGDEDLLLSGKNDYDDAITKLYTNNGDSTFTEQTKAVFPGVWQSSVAWGNYNGDNYPDILIAGKDSTGTRISKLYSNNGDSTFTEQTLAVFIGVSSGSLAWANYDNQNYDDVLITGFNGGGQAKLYKNNGDSTFTEEAVGLTGVYYSSIAWSDYNGDTFLDILLTGFDGGSPVAKLYENNQNGTFTEQAIGLSGVMYSSVDWGDYNNDLNPDILLTGYDGGIISRIYSNNGDETFTELSEGITGNITGVRYSSVAWGDYNNDNYDDILLTGDSLLGSETPFSKIYKNNGDSTFTELTTEIANTDRGSVSWCDYNKDNFLDFIISGSDLISNITKLYTNNQSGGFEILNKETAYGQFITFDEIEGVEFGSVAWGDYDNDSFPDFILSGNNILDTITKLFRNNGNGTFSEQKQIDLTNVTNGSVTWGDYNNDSFQDILLTGYNSIEGCISKIYKNIGDGTFVDINAGLTGVWYGSAEWGNYDKQNGLDIIITGGTDKVGNSPVNPVTIIYKHNGGDNFTEQTLINITEVLKSSVAWGDYNNDTFLDIILSGQSNSDYISKIYKNNGIGNFDEQTQIELTGNRNGSVAWADFDNDNNLDILVSGGIGGSEGITELLKNNGDGSFDNLQHNLPHITHGRAKCFDFNNDGFQDIIFLGIASQVTISKVYANNGDFTFTEQTQVDLTKVFNVSVDCIDYNKDGFQDILLTGVEQIGEEYKEIAALYANTGKSNFERMNFTFPKITKSYVSSADYNKDGYFDFGLYGIDSDSSQVAEIFKTNSFGFQRTDIELPKLKDASFSWGDYNNNGYLDLVVCGINSLGIPDTKLLENSTTGKFIETQTYITGISNGFIEWIDYNNDGTLDILISGNTGSILITKIYKNTGDGFIETQTILPGSTNAKWADFNNDGLWDILLIDINKTIKLFQNKGNDNFLETHSYPNIYDLVKEIKFSDYDNNGFDDILTITQYIHTGASKLLFHKNNENGTFSEPKKIDLGFIEYSSNKYLDVNDFDFDGKPNLFVNNCIYNGDHFVKIFDNDTSLLKNITSILGTNAGSVAWADFDNDTDMDFFTTGVLENDTIGKVFYNQGSDFNTRPDPPDSLRFECNADTVFIEWNKAPDTDQTPQAAFTYNCYMYEIGSGGTAGDTIWHSMSNHSLGKRYISRPGNTGHNTKWFITGLDVNKRYAWSVQTIDNSYLGSEFANEDTFRLAPQFIVQPIKEVSVCEKGSTFFSTITTAADSYQWYEIIEDSLISIGNGSEYANVDLPNLIIKNAELRDSTGHIYKFICGATTYDNTTYSDTVTLTVDSLISAQAGSDVSICVESQYQLSANDPSPAVGTWSCNLEQVGFNDINSYDAIVSGLPEGSVNLTWTILQDNSCGTNSDVMIITRTLTGSRPDKPAIPTGVSEICIGTSSIAVTEGSNTATSYEWEISPANAGIINGTQKTSTTVWGIGFSGSAVIKVKAKNNCGFGDFSDEFSVNLKELEPTDIIQKSSIMLVSVDAGYSYQWYHNDSPISGANKQYYYNENMPAGDYRVRITYHEGCNKSSIIYTVGSAIKTLTLDETIKIYPNPTTGGITIEIDNDYICKVEYKIIDNLGKSIKSDIIIKEQKFVTVTEDISNLKSGNYIIEFAFDDKEKVSKQIIIK